MKCMSRRLSFALTLASSMVVLSPLAGDSLLPLPSDAEIESLYSATNASDVLYGRLNGLMSCIRDRGKEYSTSDLFRVEYLLMTNIVLCPIEQHGLRFFANKKEILLDGVSMFDVVKNDMKALLYVVDYIGTLQLYSTSNMNCECMAAWNDDEDYRRQAGTDFYGSNAVRSCSYMTGFRYPQHTPNMDRYLEKWMPKVSFNGLVPGLRRELMYCLNPAVNHHMMEMGEAERIQFRSNIIERAKLDEREAQLLFR